MGRLFPLVLPRCTSGLGQDGQRPQDPPHVLQGKAVPQAHSPQGHPVQDGQGLAFRSGKASLRQEAVRIRWSDQARLPQEGQDDQEGRPPARVHRLQVQDADGSQALQALRAWWWQEAEGPGSYLLRYSLYCLLTVRLVSRMSCGRLRRRERGCSLARCPILPLPSLSRRNRAAPIL